MTLSDQQWLALWSIAKDGDPYGGCCDQSEYGGRTRTLAALVRLGLIDCKFMLTLIGKQALEERYKP